MNHRLRFALFGTGNFSTVFGKFIAEQAEVVAICDPSKESRLRFAKATGIEAIEFDNYQALLASVTEIDAVALTGPNNSHYPIAIVAAKLGKHVFCEKTMAPTLEQCWEMVRACDAANVKLMVGHKRRLRAPWARVIQLRETLGPVVAMSIVGYFDARPDNFGGWWVKESESGGTLAVSGVHEIDWMRALCGDVETVSAIAPPQIDQRYDFPDSLHVNLRFRSGAVGFLGVSLSYPLTRYRQVVGAKVVCRDGGIDLRTSLHDAEVNWKLSIDPQEHSEIFSEPGGDPIGANEALRKEIREFIQWITDGVQPSLTWREGLRAVEVIEAARLSAAQSARWIELPLHPELESL